MAAPSLLRVFYTVQGEGEENDDSVPNCFLMDRPSSGLLKAHDVLARFPPAAAAAEVCRYEMEDASITCISSTPLVHPSIP